MPRTFTAGGVMPGRASRASKGAVHSCSPPQTGAFCHRQSNKNNKNTRGDGPPEDAGLSKQSAGLAVCDVSYKVRAWPFKMPVYL
jgi:hypothetical protein